MTEPNRMIHWTNDRIVDALVEERLAFGRFPRRRDWRDSSDLHPCSETVVKRFGTWLDALAIADKGAAPVEEDVTVSPKVVEFALASLPPSDARRVRPIAFRFDYAPPDGELHLERGPLQRFLWREFPTARGIELAEKFEIVAALARFLRVLPDSPAAATFAETCESLKTAKALIRPA